MFHLLPGKQFEKVTLTTCKERLFVLVKPNGEKNLTGLSKQKHSPNVALERSGCETFLKFHGKELLVKFFLN